jgi:glycerophosphoryl diester phosphodiesterase
MEILAHRGASADAAENTLSAFREAVTQGADGVELDVRRCGTGEVVVCHDERLDRLAGVDWEVERTPWERLREVEVGRPIGRVPDRIPLLAEVLAALPPELTVNVELKCERLGDRGLTASALQVVREAGAIDRVVFSSFNALCLVRLRLLEAKVRRGYLIDPDRWWPLHGTVLAPVLSSFSVHPHHGDITEARARRWKGAGLRIAAWTVDDADEAARLQSLGVDYLITNRPARLREALRSRGRP